jgi:hypothetical protein
MVQQVAGPSPVWFGGLVWESSAIVALNALDAITTLWALSLGAVELNGVAAFLLAGGPAGFLAAKLLFAGWVVIGLAWIHREWSARYARLGAHANVLVLTAVVAWNSTMLAFLA